MGFKSMWSTKTFCIDKARDNRGKITAYRLRTLDCRTFDIGSDELKQRMARMDIEVANLTLTSDNRLMEKQIPIEKLDMELVNYCLNKIKTDEKAYISEETPTFVRAGKTCYGGNDYNDAELIMWISPMNTLYVSATSYNGRNKNGLVKDKEKFDDIYTAFTA